MDRFGIIGWPVQHSLSPKLFTAAYAGRFCYELLGRPSFEESWKSFLDGGFKAINVTAPYKEQALECSDIKSESALRVGAANIIVRTDNGLTAYNSDYSGVKACLSGAGTVVGDKVLVVGCGGAGRAAAAAAADLGLEVRVCNRHAARAEKIAEEIGGITAVPFEKNFRADIVIYTLPAPVPGMERFRGKVILEANYACPSYTADLLDRLGANYIPGKKWLLEQALSGYSLMTGIAPDAGALAKSLPL